MAKPLISEKLEEAPYHCVFLQPHRDDICFSLGAFAARQIGSLMITICTVSDWVHPQAVPVRPSQEDVTSMRKVEDQAFADDAGLASHFFALPEAPIMGWSPWDLSRAIENQQRVETPLLAELARIAPGKTAAERPWLFCPAGIGGHVDHVAVLFTVLSHAEELSRHFRIAFYEDLHYASRWRARMTGLARFFAETKETRLKRWIFPLDEYAINRKLQLITHYGSQIPEAPSDLSDYAPSTLPGFRPHEAIWTAEQPPDGFRLAPQGEVEEFLGRKLAKLRRSNRV